MNVKLSKDNLRKLRMSKEPVPIRFHKTDTNPNAKLFLNKTDMKMIGGSKRKVFVVTLSKKNWKKSQDFINDVNFVTSNDDLVYLMRNVRRFRTGKRNREYSLNKGKNIFSETNLPDSVEPNTCGIIHIEDSGSTVADAPPSVGRSTPPSVGHWVGYFDDDNLNFILYIDPLNEEINSNVVKFLQSGNKKINHIGKRIQHFDSSKCGLYVVDILRDLNKLKRINSKTVSKVIDQYEDVGDGINDELDSLQNELKVVSDVVAQ